MKSHPINKLISLILIGLVITSCSTLSVTSDYDKSVDFTKYKTFEYYGWAKESDKILNDLDKRRIEQAFSDEFKRRGMTYVKSGGDLVVTLFIVVEKKKQQTAHTSHVGGYYGSYDGYGPGWGISPGFSTTTISEYEYKVGTLVCDVFDKQKEQLIWEGIGSGTVDDNPNTRDEKIPQAVAKIMAQYPVQPIGSGK